MARIRCVESTRKVGGWLSNEYEDDYLVEKDDGSCHKVFTTYKEAELYQNYLQQQENLEKLASEQQRTADEIATLRKATEERNQIDRERPFHLPFPQTGKQALNPEFQEWLQFKKATDPEFAKWKRAKEWKEEAARIAEKSRWRAAAEAEQHRITVELARKKKEEEVLKSYEEDILNRKKLPCQLRVKVAKETFREEVMLRCVRDSAISVFNALKQNPNLTSKVQTLITKRENPLVNNSSISKNPSSPHDEDGIGYIGWILIIIAIIVEIILYINS